MDINDLHPDDYKYVIDRPDRSFNPARNKAIIEETIKEADTFHRGTGKLIEDPLGERIEAVAAYGCYRFNGGERNVKGYLGDSIYKKLVGEHILEKIRVAQTMNRLNGNTRFKNAIML